MAMKIAATGRRRLDATITILVIAILVVITAILVLMVFSIDRTSWAFALYEHGRPDAESLGRWAAWVLEGAAVAFIAAEIVIDSTRHKAQYYYVFVGLVLILTVQSLSNGINGWVNGWNESRRIIGKDEGWGLAAAALLWGTVNASLPVLIFILSKLLAWLIRQLLAALETEKLVDVQAMRDKLAAQLAHMTRWAGRWQTIARRQQATIADLHATVEQVRQRATGLQHLADHGKRWIDIWRNVARGLKADVLAAQAIILTKDRTIAQGEENLEKARKLWQGEKERADHITERFDMQRNTINSLLDRPAVLGDAAPADVAAWLAASPYTVGDIARAMLEHLGGRKEDSALAMGASLPAFTKWLELPGKRQPADEIEVIA